MIGLIVSLAICLIFTSQSVCDEILLEFRKGKPIADRKAAWKGHINFASWVDDEFVVYSSRKKISCISTKSGKMKWSVRDVGEIDDWSVSRKLKRLAVLTAKNTISVFDCSNGKKIFNANRDQLTKLLGVEFVNPIRVALIPNDGRLIVCNFSLSYGRNGFVLDPLYERVLSSFNIDAAPRVVLVSESGERISVIAKDDVLCILDWQKNKELFFKGNRIKTKQNGFFGGADSPFYSNVRASDGDLLVYTIDNSWETGEVYIHNFKTKKTKCFNSRNGHNEIDVSFAENRIAISGTSTNLTILDFDGHQIAHLKDASLQRNRVVEFSPDGDRILVGSWDTTLSVFSVVKNSK